MQVKAWYEQGHVDGLSATELWELCHVHSEYRKRYADYWREMSNRTRSGRAVDGVIQPVAATTAVRDSEFHYYGYTAVANVLDYPAAAFPVQVGSSSFDDNMPHGPPFNAVDALVRSCCTSQSAYPYATRTVANVSRRSSGRREGYARGAASHWPAAPRRARPRDGASDFERVVGV